MKILFVPLEFLRWQEARSMGYTAQLAFEEGFRHHGIEVMTIPAWGNVPSSSPSSWLSRARDLVAGERFDQIWVTLVHSPLDDDLLSWFARLAPVRVGLVIESLTYTAEECALHPPFKERRAYVEQQIRAFTHVLTVDERDAEKMNAGKLVSALWWPSPVPARLVAANARAPRPAAAEFYGSVYGERAVWMQRPDLQGILVRPPSPEDAAGLPQRFDSLHADTVRRLQNTRNVTREHLQKYLDAWRPLRSQIFDCWIAALRNACAQVNLPSFVKAHAGRVVESMAAGSPVISWDVPDRPRNHALFRDGEEILFFQRDQPAQLAELIRRVQQDPKWAQSIAERALRKVRTYHTVEARVQQVLEWIASSTGPDYGEASSSTGPSKQNETEKSDSFYVDLFVNTPKWSSPTPNVDEVARWQCIEPLVRRIASRNEGTAGIPLRILDVGCGRGWLTNLLSDFGQAEGVEPVAAVVDHAATLFPKITFTAGTAETILQRPDFAPYDLVVSSEVIEHVPESEKPAFVSRLAGLLKPGGHVIITTPRGEALEAWTRLIGDPSQPVEDWMTEARLSKLFTEQGFRAAGLEKVWYDIPSRSFVPAAPDQSSENLLAIYQVWAFQLPGATGFAKPEALAPSSVSFNPFKPDYANTPVSALRPQFDYQPANVSAAPVVTIVTPFFNAGPVFHETAQSVFRQSLQQWEWLIINDGSTDPASLKLLDEFRQKDPRIRVLNHSRNKGLSAARNTGFREAQAKFVFQLDADDLIEPTTLEKMAWHLTTHPEFAFTTGFTVGFGSMQYLWRNGFHSGKAFLEENLVTATCLVRKSVHQSVGGYDDQNRGGLEDWDFWVKAAANGHWGSTIPEFFDWYRRRDTGREHWDNVVVKDKTAQFKAKLRQRYPGLWQRGFPEITVNRPQLASTLTNALPFENALVKKAPRLLFLVPHFELGGADKFNLDLIRQLQREHGYQVTVVGTRRSPNPWLHEFQSLTPDVFTLNNFLLTSDFALFLRYLITSRRPDVVCLSNSLLGYQLLPCLRSYFPELPFVDYLHMEQEDWMAGGYPRYSLLSQSQLARTAVSSQHLKNWLVTRGAEPGAIEVCTTNIDTQHWRRDRFDGAAMAKKWNVDRSRPTILYAGRICDQKQPRVLAEVIRQVAGAHPGFNVLVAGDGPDLPWLKEYVERERLRQVRFLDAVANDDMPGLLAISDIFFLPSKWEGISLAIYEAMAMETVPVSAVVGGQAELVTPDCGVLVRRGPGEAADYATALLKLLRSPQKRIQMARAARDRVAQKFPIADLGQRMHATFEAARTVAFASRLDSVLPADLAAIHAAGIVEQTRATELADAFYREREELLPFVKHSVEWRASCRAAQSLAEARQTRAALAMFDTALQAALASNNPEIQLAAHLEIGRNLVPLDRQKAGTVLRDTLRLAERVGDTNARQTAEQVLAGLPKASAVAAAPQSEAVVSVVIPCFKQAHFLTEAVESVVAQTFANWEIVIVNDGSPDNTSEVARSLMAKHSRQRITLIEQSNRGLPAARNAGIRAAKGRFILPLDADDKIHPTLVEKLLRVLETNPKVGFAYTHIQHFGALDTEFPLPDFDRATLISRDNIACVCSLFRRSVWEQVGGYNEAMREGYEDWDFWIGCVGHGWDGYCLHEPLFYYRKQSRSMLGDANQKRERLISQIILNHPRLYDAESRARAERVLSEAAPAVSAPIVSHEGTVTTQGTPLRITYLISSILGVTGGNQTLLRQAEEMRRRGHEVTIVTYTPKPEWFQFQTRVIQVPAGDQMASHVPPSDVVVATYFTNAPELESIQAPVKVYYAQGDQFIFEDATMADTEQNRRLRELSRASYLLPGIRFVPNSRNLAGAVEKLCGRKPDGILPVCTDQTIFRPLQRSLPGSRFRLLIVGPDARGTVAEPLLFKGIQDTHDALQLLTKRFPHFTAVRMSATGPDIFSRFPCEFYIAPSDEMKTVLFGTSHIHIYASHYDSCPRPPQEAMAAGCAVVCTATPGALEYCRDGENSLLVPVQSAAAIADAVERLIRDHALRDKLVQGGLATAHEFPREREWNEWEQMLQRFVKETANKQTQPITIEPSNRKPATTATIPLPPCARLGHLGKARTLLGDKKLRAAWEATLAAIHTRPFHPEAFLLLAQIAAAAGDSSASRRCAQHARSLAPGWKPVTRFLKTQIRGNARHEWLVLPDALAATPAARPRLSICLIVKNEEKFLGRCLESVGALAHQIVVVDTGSTDRTIAIAEEHGAEVHNFGWCDDFSAARNAALEHATGDWILMLDADEELPLESHESLRKLLAEPSVIAWRLPIIDVGRENEGCCYVPRLYRNAPGLFYIGRVHEQVFTSIEVRREEWGLDNRLGDAAIRHHGYRPEVVRDRNKIERNLRLLEKAILELPDEPNLLMNYGLELVRSGKVEHGMEQYRKAFDLMSAQPSALVVPETREMLLSQLCTHLIARRQFTEIVRVLNSPLAQAGGLTASLHFALGLAHLELKQSREAADQMRQCLATRTQPSLSPINPEILKAGPHHCLALSLAQSGDPAAAEEFRAAIKDDPQSRPARFDYARYLFARSQPVEALNLLFELANEKTDDPSVWLLGGQIALGQPEFLEVALDWTTEARRFLPQHAGILRLRAEALLLANHCAEALPCWRQLCPESNPSAAAALLLCETAANDAQFSVPPDQEMEVSREFLKWYQQLIQFNGRPTIEAINARLDSLALQLPSVARMLQEAIAQVPATQ